MSGEARFLCVFSNNSKVVVKRRRMNPSSSGRQKNVRHFAQRQYNPTLSTFFVSVQPYFTYLLFLCQLNPIMRRHTQFFVIFFFDRKEYSREREKNTRERGGRGFDQPRVLVFFCTDRLRRTARATRTTTLDDDDDDVFCVGARRATKKKTKRRRDLLF